MAGAHRLVPISEDEVVTFPDLSIWEQRYQCLVEREINPDRSITDLMTAIRGSHVLSERDDEIEIAETITPLEVP